MSLQKLANAYNIIAIISCGIVIIFQFTLLSILFYKLQLSINSHKVIKSIKYSTFACYSSLCTAYLMLMLSRIVYLSNQKSDAWIPFWILYYSFAGIAIISVYIFLIARLYETFLGTVYQIKRCTIYIHLIIASLAFLSMISVSIVGQFEDSGYSYINLIVAILLFCMGLGHLMYVFNHSLFLQVLSDRLERRKFRSHRSQSQSATKKVVVMAKLDDTKENTITPEAVSPSNNNPTHEKEYSVELHHLQLELLGTVRKHTLLSIMIVVSFGIATVTPWLYIFCDTESCYGSFWSLWYPLHAIFINISGLCIYLGFTVNKTIYQRLCIICDSQCESLCKKLTKKRLKQSPNVKI